MSILRLLVASVLACCLATATALPAQDEAASAAPVTANETTAEQAIPAAEAPAPVAEEPGLQARINDWVGSNLVGPLWVYFLGAPVFKTTAIAIVEADDAAINAASTTLEDPSVNITNWTAGVEGAEGTSRLFVASGDVAAAKAALTDSGLPRWKSVV